MDNLLKTALKRASQKALLGENPDLPEKAILYALAKNGPQTLAELVKTTSTFGDWETNHYTVKRRFNGLKNHMSMIDYEFVKERKPEKRKPGKYGKVYCLTTKGFLSSLSVGLTLEKIDIFKKYIRFLSDILDRKITYMGLHVGEDSTLDDEEKKTILELITSYIKLQIVVFLIWHEINEISIRRKTNSNWYIEDFFNNHDEFIYLEFPKTLDKKAESEYREILRDYFTTSKILHGLTEFAADGNKKIVDNIRQLAPFVFNWYRYFDELQMRNQIGKAYDIKKIPSQVLSRPEYGIDIEYTGEIGKKVKIQPDIKNKVSNELKRILGKEMPVDKIWNSKQDRKRIVNPFV